MVIWENDLGDDTGEKLAFEKMEMSDGCDDRHL